MKLPGLNRLKLLHIHFIAAAFLLSFCGGMGSINAQNPLLYSNNWYLEKVVVGNQSYYITDFTYYVATISFFDVPSKVEVFYCQLDDFEADINFPGSTGFEISNVVLNPFFGDCAYDGNSHQFSNLYFSIYLDISDLPKNPFTYTIVPINNYHQLTVTNVDGDWAVYNSVLLSSRDFNKASFSIFPNPVEETLQVSNASNQTVKASIYNVNGKKLQSHSFQNSQSSVDVKALTPGLYFVVFESEAGERVSKKFVKK